MQRTNKTPNTTLSIQDKLDPNRPHRSAVAVEILKIKIQAAKIKRKKQSSQPAIPSYEIGQSVSFREEIIQCENAFQTEYDRYSKLDLEKLTAPERENEFSKLLTQITVLQGCIEKLSKPKHQRELGITEAKRIINVYYNKIGLAYFFNKNFSEARKWFKQPINNGFFPAVLNNFYCAQEEGNLNEMAISSHILLDAYGRNKQNNTADLDDMLLSAGKCAIFVAIKSESYEELDTLILEYPQYFELSHFSEIISLHENNNRPEHAVTWRIKLLTFIKKNKIALDKALIQEYSLEYHFISLLKSYLREKKYLECALLIESNKGIINTVNYVTCAAQFFTEEQMVAPSLLLKAKAWLMQGLAEKLPEASSLYLDVCYGGRHSHHFDRKEAFTFVQSIIDWDHCKDQAYHLYGRFYDEGYGIQQSDELAFKFYQLSADLNYPRALHDLAVMYRVGQGREPDPQQALALFRKSYNLGNIEAVLEMHDMLTYLKDGVSPISLEEMLHLLNDARKRVVSNNYRDHYRHQLLSKIAYCISCLLVQAHPSDDASYLPSINIFRYYTKVNITENSPQIINGFLQAAEFGDNSLKEKALFNLGTHNLSGTNTPRNLQQAEQFFLQAQEAASQVENTSVPSSLILIYLAIVYNSRSIDAAEHEDKRKLQLKALSLYQKAMMYDEESCINSEVIHYFHFIYEQILPRNLDAKRSNAAHPKIPLLIGCFDDVPTLKLHLSRQMKQIQITLSKNRTEDLHESIEHVSENIRQLRDHMNDYSNFFPILTQLADFTALVSCQQNVLTLLRLIKNIKKWNLAPAIEKCEPLLPLIMLNTLSFTDLSYALYIISTSGFKAETIKKFITPYAEYLALAPFINKQDSLHLADCALFVYALAILNVTTSIECLAVAAKKTLKVINNNCAEAKFHSISQFYHAYRYFQLKYPQQKFVVSPLLQNYLDAYSESLKDEFAISPSHTQQAVYAVLHELNSNVTHEAFIPNAGRRVDFLLNNLVIQYNGTRTHYLYENDGCIARLSPKDQLCTETLKLAGYKVSIIDGPSWHKVRNNKQSQIEYLQRKLPDLNAEIARRFSL